MSYVTNVMFVAKHVDWTVDDKIEWKGWRKINRYAGGPEHFQDDIWAMAVDHLDERYRDDLFNILKGNVTDCYLYEQSEDFPARIYALDSYGWKEISNGEF